jgi:hypothetical protein
MPSARPFITDFYADGPEYDLRACDHAGCAAHGEFRAPKAPDRLNDFYWFCLEHVRAYNKAWDFCRGKSETEIESMIRDSTCWERPTRPMAGGWKVHEQRMRDAVLEDFIVGGGHAESARAPKGQPRHFTAEAKALSVLGIEPPTSYVAIKARYKELAKIHHPDANGGSRESEDKIKEINEALQVLKAAYDS